MLRSRCFHESQWRFFIFMYNFYIKYLYKILCIILTHYGSSIVMDFCTSPVGPAAILIVCNRIHDYSTIIITQKPSPRFWSSRYEKALEIPIFIQASPHEFLTMNLLIESLYPTTSNECPPKACSHDPGIGITLVLANCSDMKDS